MRGSCERLRDGPLHEARGGNRNIGRRRAQEITTCDHELPPWFRCLPLDVPRQGWARLISGLLFPYRRLILAFPAVSQALRRLTAARGIDLRYLFENYSFDTDRRELHRGTDVIAIAPQVFDLLNYLIDNRERVVSKDDLIRAIWQGRVVSDVALTTRLNAVRKAIGDSGDEQRLIKTVTRKGFRFVGTVHETPEPTGAAVASGSPSSTFVLADRPSLVVLPFINLSPDSEQEYFGDGVTESLN